MLARVQSYLLQGIDALPCEVEVDLDHLEQDKKQMVVGLPDAAVKEAVERVRSALVNSGYLFPAGRVLINLAPADVRKEGPLYDLPIAVGILVNTGVVRALPGATEKLPGFDSGVDLRRYLIAGELALDGRVRSIRGAIAVAALAKTKGYSGVIVPAVNAEEAAVVPGVEVLGVRTLAEVVGLLRGEIEATPTPPPDIETLLRTANAPVDFGEIRGQESVKRAVVVAAAGSHNLLPDGAGNGRKSGIRRPCRAHNRFPDGARIQPGGRRGRDFQARHRLREVAGDGHGGDRRALNRRVRACR